MVDSGSRVSFLGIFNKGVLVLIRKLDFGTSAILKKLQERLGVDAETAQGIVADTSFDISQALHDSMEVFIRQMVISRDFVEGRENCHVARLYACGGAVHFRHWVSEVQSAVGLPTETWNPFEGFPAGPLAIPENVKGDASRFAAAVGAALGTIEEE